VITQQFRHRPAQAFRNPEQQWTVKAVIRVTADVAIIAEVIPDR